MVLHKLLELGSGFYGSTVAQYLVFTAVLVVGGLLAKLVLYLFKQSLEKQRNKSGTKFDRVIVSVLGKPFAFFVITLAAISGRHILTPTPAFARLLDGSLKVMVILSITWIVIRFFDSAIDKYVRSYAVESGTRTEEQLIPVLKRSIKILLIGLGGVVLVDSFGYDVTALIASFGIGGLAVAFAAKETIGDIFGGVTLFTSKPFIVGDSVEIDGVSGQVEEIGLRYPKTRTWDKQVVTMPNGKVASSDILNKSLEPARRIIMFVGLTYQASSDEIERAKEIIEDSINDVDGILEDDTATWLWEYSDSSLKIRVQYYVSPENSWLDVKDEINIGIKRQFDEYGVNIAYPTQRVFIEDGDGKVIDSSETQVNHEKK
ncbi:MAG: mechanosensitive ion channel family protein [Halobacteria archaeon]